MRLRNSAWVLCDMNFWRRLLTPFKASSTLRFETELRYSGNSFQDGDRTRDGRKTFLMGGPPADPHARWMGPFPPTGHIDLKPTVGTMCTVTYGELLRRGKIRVASPTEVVVAVEYQHDTDLYVLQSDGSWRDGPNHFKRLYIGIEATNFKHFKTWYRDDQISHGWVLY